MVINSVFCHIDFTPGSLPSTISGQFRLPSMMFMVVVKFMTCRQRLGSLWSFYHLALYGQPNLIVFLELQLIIISLDFNLATFVGSNELYWFRTGLLSDTHDFTVVLIQEFESWPGIFLHRVFMFSLGGCIGSPHVSSHRPKTWLLGQLVSLTCH